MRSSFAFVVLATVFFSLVSLAAGSPYRKDLPILPYPWEDKPHRPHPLIFENGDSLTRTMCYCATDSTDNDLQAGAYYHFAYHSHRYNKDFHANHMCLAPELTNRCTTTFKQTEKHCRDFSPGWHFCYDQQGEHGDSFSVNGQRRHLPKHPSHKLPDFTAMDYQRPYGYKPNSVLAVCSKICKDEFDLEIMDPFGKYRQSKVETFSGLKDICFDCEDAPKEMGCENGCKNKRDLNSTKVSWNSTMPQLNSTSSGTDSVALDNALIVKSEKLETVSTSEDLVIPKRPYPYSSRHGKRCMKKVKDFDMHGSPKWGLGCEGVRECYNNGDCKDFVGCCDIPISGLFNGPPGARYCRHAVKHFNIHESSKHGRDCDGVRECYRNGDRKEFRGCCHIPYSDRGSEFPSTWPNTGSPGQRHCSQAIKAFDTTPESSKWGSGCVGVKRCLLSGGCQELLGCCHTGFRLRPHDPEQKRELNSTMPSLNTTAPYLNSTGPLLNSTTANITFTSTGNTLMSRALNSTIPAGLNTKAPYVNSTAVNMSSTFPGKELLSRGMNSTNVSTNSTLAGRTLMSQGLNSTMPASLNSTVPCLNSTTPGMNSTASSANSTSQTTSLQKRDTNSSSTLVSRSMPMYKVWMKHCDILRKDYPEGFPLGTNDVTLRCEGVQTCFAQGGCRGPAWFHCCH